ncbi:hypothetical protein ACFO3K_17780 [Cellulomonas algicola]|uniref:hypothetical protein n=2 Tax=Cellulomonas algicola TaxID=2071633 RepID=UPI001C3FEAED|nr:hypothetical protein [Cellulomonas algicola]
MTTSRTSHPARAARAALVAALALPMLAACAFVVPLSTDQAAPADRGAPADRAARAHREAPADPCAPEVAPPGSSPAAVAYLAAVEATSADRMALSDRIESQGRKLYDVDLATEVAIDERFLVDLRAITFPPEVRPEADAFEAALVAYLDFVRTAAAQPGYYGEHPDVATAVNNARGSAGSALRDALDLPPNGCVVNRP